MLGPYQHHYVRIDTSLGWEGFAGGPYIMHSAADPIGPEVSAGLCGFCLK